jgi:hypothetical protein
MKEIKKSIEIIDRIESEDGKVGYSIGKTGFSEEEARQKIEKYEKMASTVLFKRLVDNGVLTELKTHSDGSLTEEQKAENDVIGIADGITDNYCGTYTFYIYEPKTEEDIRDLLTYGKLDDEDIYFPREDSYSGIIACTEKELVVGKRYLFCEHCDGYKHLYRLDTLRARLNGWIDWLERR